MKDGHTRNWDAGDTFTGTGRVCWCICRQILVRVHDGFLVLWWWWWWFLMVILYMERNKEREENNRVSTRVNHKMSMVTVNFNCGTFRWSTKDLGDGGWWGW